MHIVAYKSRCTRESITFTDADGEEITIDAGDKVRLKVGRQLSSPVLDVVSGTPLAGGTSVTATNPAIFVIDQDDLANMRPGVYDLEAAIVDASDAGRIKHAEQGVFTLIGTQGGEVT